MKPRLKDKQNDNLYPDSLRKEEKNTQINKIENEREKFTTGITEIWTTIREYYEQLYANKLANLEEVDKSLETYIHPRLNQEETDNPKRPITSIDIELVNQKLPKNESWLDWLHRGTLPNIWRRVSTYPSQIIPKHWRGGNTPKFILRSHN